MKPGHHLRWPTFVSFSLLQSINSQKKDITFSDGGEKIISGRSEPERAGEYSFIHGYGRGGASNLIIFRMVSYANGGLRRRFISTLVLARTREISISAADI